jgi:hypothetical protein
MSFLLNLTIPLISPFKKYFGSMDDPMKNPTNARISVITRLSEGLFIDKIKNTANRKSTISGLKI